jgi:hypothetical protein
MSIDRPEAAWEEPRGPHLPDAVTRIPGAAWPFLLVAILVAWRSLGTFAANQPDDAGAAILLSGVSIGGTVAACLVGAALFLRHPDAHHAHRALALGSALIALSYLGKAYRIDVDGWLRDLTGDEPFGISPFTSAYGTMLTVAIAGGVFALARGLVAARALPSRMPAGWLLAVAFAIPVAAAIEDVLLVTSNADQLDMAFPFALQLALGVIGSLAIGFAWATLAVTSLLGARAGEEPRAGWWVVAIAAWVHLVAPVGLAIATLPAVPVADGVASTGFNIFLLFTAIGSASWFLVLAAFVVGLPLGRRRPA